MKLSLIPALLTIQTALFGFNGSACNGSNFQITTISEMMSSSAPLVDEAEVAEAVFERSFRNQETLSPKNQKIVRALEQEFGEWPAKKIFEFDVKAFIGALYQVETIKGINQEKQAVRDLTFDQVIDRCKQVVEKYGYGTTFGNYYSSRLQVRLDTTFGPGTFQRYQESCKKRIAAEVGAPPQFVEAPKPTPQPAQKPKLPPQKANGKKKKSKK